MGAQDRDWSARRSMMDVSLLLCMHMRILTIRAELVQIDGYGNTARSRVHTYVARGHPHGLSLLAPHFAPGCRWRGTRVDEFQRHLNTQRCGPRPEERQYQIYNVKMILSWIKDSQGGDIISTTQSFAVDLVKERALELGKREWLEDPWGHSGRHHSASGA